VKKDILTKKEQKVLYGITKYPNINDSELSDIINIKLSTLTSIKKRLYAQGYYRTLDVPLLNRLGAELLAVIYTTFNPVIPLDERVKTTKATIEVFEEIFFSVGEQEKGFSISLSKNYTNIGRINEIRTETFGKVGLLENEYPNESIFPFEISHINRFFDFARVLKNLFNIEDDDSKNNTDTWFKDINKNYLSEKEKKVYVELIKNPDATTQQIGKNIGLSRHTVSRMKKNFYDENLLKKITLPSLNHLGFEILAFYPIKFNPNKSPKKQDIDVLDTYSTIFLARRQFETVIISAYSTYQDYKEDKMNKIRYLKENNFISYSPIVGKYVLEKMTVIKDFDFAPIAQKVISNII
jgi:DNA-binding MarR family transcriptional regulator